MKTLHGLLNNQNSIYAWYQIYGGNGRPITPVPHQWGTGFAHLFRIERGAPPPRPPVNDGSYQNMTIDRRRRYWVPFGTGDLNRTQALDPICHTVRSRSQAPRLSETPAGSWNHVPCEDCTRIALQQGITATSPALTRQNDPWSLLSGNERVITIDPVSGV